MEWHSRLKHCTAVHILYLICRYLQVIYGSKWRVLLITTKPAINIFLSQTVSLVKMINQCRLSSPSIKCSCSNSLSTDTVSITFWHEILRDYESDRILPLPNDRQLVCVDARTDRVWSITFYFNSDISRALVDYASTANTTPKLLLLTCYYIFLFKLTNGEKDLCVWQNISVQQQFQLFGVNTWVYFWHPLYTLEFRITFNSFLICT